MPDQNAISRITGNAPTVQKILPLTAQAFTTAASITLLCLRNNVYTGNVVNFVRHNRATVQIVVQAVSQGLGLLQLYVLRTLFNFAIRLNLEKHSISLDGYAMRSAVSQLVMDWTLSKPFVTLLLFITLLATVPGALWAGALTPVQSQATTAYQILVPAFSNASSHIWNSEFQHQPNGQIFNLVQNCQLIHDARGFFPTCPVPGLAGQLLLSASTATTNLNETRIHSKLDNPRWSYLGRSYGVGASVGLASLEDANLMSYEYNETGYIAELDCFRNATSQLKFELRADSGASYPVYDLTGAMSIMPQNLSDDFPSATWNYDASGLLAWKARAYRGRNMISVASGEHNYTLFHHVECNVFFKSATFNIFANASSSEITITPIGDSEESKTSDTLIFNVMQSVNLLSRMSNSNYVSIRGNALQANYDNMVLQTGRDYEETVISAVADSFAAIIDDIFVAYGAHSSPSLTIQRRSLQVFKLKRFV
jgi:hypothetical protein